MKRWLAAVVLVACGCRPTSLAPAAARPAEASGGHALYRGVAMGSDLEIEVFGDTQELCDRAVADAVAEIARLDAMMTDWKAVSPLMEINYNAGQRAVRVPPELFFLIQKSVEMSRVTDGAFDISFAGAGKLWNWRAERPDVPPAEAVEAALRNVGFEGIVLDAEARTVYLARSGMRIGLGAVAPGYAGDRAMEMIRARGIRDACVNVSGDVLVSGRRNGAPWNVGIRHPREVGKNVAVIPVSNAAVSTSGDYERFFEKDGKRYSHIIDPRTGYPARECQSVTIVAPVLAVADALATGVFVLGPERGMELVERLEGVEAMIVDAEGALHVSTGLRAP